MPSLSILLRGGIVLTHDDNDRVVALHDTDVLISDDKIADVRKGIDPPGSATEIIDCKGKIISPGFVNTHHHLWQTQLKGRHVDQGLVAYMYSGNLVSYAYKPDDVYWGQISGCLEAIHAGTTTVLDHAHCAYSPEHAQLALGATLDSGIRAVFAYTVPTRMKSWNESECVPEHDLLPEWAVAQLSNLVEKHNATPASLVEIGMGFDLWFLPKEMVLQIFEALRQKGLRLVTTHVGLNAFMGFHSTVQMLHSYGLLQKPYSRSDSAPRFPYLLLSHCNGISNADLDLLAATGTPVSSTPGTESQMALGFPVALDRVFQGKKTAHVSLGADCHANDPCSIPGQARMLLQLTRAENNAKILAKGLYPTRDVVGTSEEAFNLATIRAARCLGLEKEIGSIKVGKKADVLVFDAAGSVGMLSAAEYDPVVAVLRFSETADIEYVIVNGKIRKRKGKLVATELRLNKGGLREWQDIAEQVRRSQKDILQRIDGLSLEKARETLLSLYRTDVTLLVDAE